MSALFLVMGILTLFFIRILEASLHEVTIMLSLYSGNVNMFDLFELLAGHSMLNRLYQVGQLCIFPFWAISQIACQLPLFALILFLLSQFHIVLAELNQPLRLN